MRSLRSIHEQKQNQEKHEQTATHPDVTNGISQVDKSAKRRFGCDHASAKIINEDRKKAARINSRDQVKIEVQAEDRNLMKLQEK